MKTQLFLALSFCLMSFTATSQPKILKLHAFAKDAAYGKEFKNRIAKKPVQPSTHYFFYLEVLGDQQPEITTVSAGGKVLQAAVFPVAESIVNVGVKKSTGKKVVIERAPNTRFWKVKLSAPENELIPSAKNWIIKGKVSQRPFSYKNIKWVVLSSDIIG